MGYSAFNHKLWAERGLKDFGDYADCVSYINQVEQGDDTLEGEWFYAEDENKTIYFGTFGNDNSPGASSYTWATQYKNNPGESWGDVDFAAEVARLEAMPEYLDGE